MSLLDHAIFVGLRLKILQTIVLSTELLCPVHLCAICVRGERLAFTRMPRRFQLTAAVALAMCGCCSAPRLQKNRCPGTVSKVSLVHTRTHTDAHTRPMKSGITTAVKSWRTRVKCQKNIPICCHGNLWRFQNLQAEVAILSFLDAKIRRCNASLVSQ